MKEHRNAPAWLIRWLSSVAAILIETAPEIFSKISYAHTDHTDAHPDHTDAHAPACELPSSQNPLFAANSGCILPLVGRE